MKSIERNFDVIRQENPNWGDYACLAEAVKGKGYTRRKIYMYFRKLVRKDDYRSNEVNQLVRYLRKLSNDLEECRFFTENALRASQSKQDEHGIKVVITAEDDAKTIKNMLL